MFQSMFKAGKYLVLLCAAMLVLPLAGASAQAPAWQLGLIGASAETPVQINELRVTYRFDQMDAGKTHNSVPVQMTYRLHNPGSAQSFELAIPLAGQQDMQPAITAVFINGMEQPLSGAVNHTYASTNLNAPSMVLNLSMAPGADQIVDIRALQPVDQATLRFAFQTGKAWSGTITAGSLEAIFPYTAANWNVTLRRMDNEQTLIPLTYSGQSAKWEFNNLDARTAPDVYWTYANISAITYFDQGHAKWKMDNNDPEAYAMLHRALLDMIPCAGRTMPLVSWWDSMYETITTGLIATEVPEGQEQWMKSMERWSAGWTVMRTDNECTAKQWRPARYALSVKQLLEVPVDQRSADMRQALDNHYKFLRKLVAYTGENSLGDNPNNIPSADPLGDLKLSEADRLMLSQWDQRFASPVPDVQAPPTGTAGTAPTQDKTSFTQNVSSTLNNLLDKLPRLSFGTQMILFGIIALIVIIIIGLIVFKWQENPKLPERPADFKPKPPTVPLTGQGLSPKTQNPPPAPIVPPVSVTKHQNTPAEKPIIPWEPKKTESEKISTPPWMPAEPKKSEPAPKEQEREQNEQKKLPDEKPTFRI